MSSILFRGMICGKLNASSPTPKCTPPSPPCLMLPHYFLGGGGDMVYSFYSPVKKEVVSLNNRGGREETQLMQDEQTALVGSSHGWLALYNSRNRGMCLSNPLSGRRIDLPPLAGKPFSDEAIPEKLIMSCPPDEEDCRAVLVLFGGIEVAFCCPGRRSTQWTPLGEWRFRDAFFSLLDGFTPDNSDLANGRAYIDFAYSAARKRFVALAAKNLFTSEKINDSDLVVEYWDISDPSDPRMDRVEPLLNGVKDPRMDRVEPLSNGTLTGTIVSMYIVSVEESGLLFLVASGLHNPDWDNAEDLEFHHGVYRIQDGGGLELCSSLDDLALFVGINSIASQFTPNLKRNCIYLADPNNRVDGGQHIQIFDYQKRTCSPLYFPKLHHKTQTPITWITPTFE